MASEAVHTTVSYEGLTDVIGIPAAVADAAPVRTFAGLTLGQIAIGGLVLLALIWGMWTTREVLTLRQHKVVSVRLGELVNRFALLEARSGEEPDKVLARTHAFMSALDATLKERSTAGAIILVGEAVVSSSTDDITAAVAADVARNVPMPVALALPAPAPMATAPAAGSSPAAAGIGGSLSASSPFGAALAQPLAPAAYAQGGVDPSAQEADNGQQ